MRDYSMNKLNKTIKVCKKCGKSIYEEVYFVNADVEDGFCYHKDCLEKAGFYETAIGNMRNNSKCYLPIAYTNWELVEIALWFFKNKTGERK